MSSDPPDIVTGMQMFGFTSAGVDLDSNVLSSISASEQEWRRRIAQDSLSCRIFEESAPQEMQHNAVSCNLEDATQDAADILTAALGIGIDASTYPDHARTAVLRCGLYFGAMNALWERMRDVFTAVQVPSVTWDKDASRYRSFKEVRAWANFFKHPGFVGLGMHHPIYAMEGTDAGRAARSADSRREKDSRWTLIDTDFVKKSWTSPDGSEARKSLRPFVTACVLLPDLESLTAGLCDDYERFVQQMCSNPDYVEIVSGLSNEVGVPCSWE